VNDEDVAQLAAQLYKVGAGPAELEEALLGVRDQTREAAARRCEAVAGRKPSYWKPGAVECASEVRRMFHVCCICDRQHDEPCVQP
jgi:hypothetical protein